MPPFEGIGWRGDSARSDMHAVCGEGPAATCYELQGIESDKKKNTSGLAFSLIRKDALTMFRHGGLVTVTWQPPRGSFETVRAGAKRVAAFLSGLCDEYGIHVPVVFYPLPTGLGNWYDRMSAEQYYALYTAVMETLKDENVPNVLPGYAEAFTDGAAFRQSLQHGDGLFRRCPTAGETRPLAVNAIYIQPAGKTDTTAYAATLPLLAKAVTRFAQDRDLVPSLTTGIEGIVAKGLFHVHCYPSLRATASLTCSLAAIEATLKTVISQCRTLVATMTSFATSLSCATTAPQSLFHSSTGCTCSLNNRALCAVPGAAG